MPVTDLNSLSALMRSKIADAKAHVAKVAASTEARLDGAISTMTGAADSAAAAGEKLAQSIENEAAALLGELGQTDNGGPALTDTAPATTAAPHATPVPPAAGIVQGASVEGGTPAPFAPVSGTPVVS